MARVLKYQDFTLWSRYFTDHIYMWQNEHTHDTITGGIHGKDRQMAAPTAARRWDGR